MGRDVVIDPDVLITGTHYISLHDNVHISRGCIISGGPSANTVSETRRLANGRFGLSEGEVSIGRGTHIAAGCYILGHGGVRIGDFCGLAGGTRILSISNHYASFSDRSRRDIYFTLYAGAEHACYLIGPVVLGDNVGVASNVVLLPGATVCNDSFVTIGSVVHPGVIPPNSIASGNPAALVKQRFTPPRSSE
jgi:acetyltransferase-like isoleucine patch superfamily enzyme